MNHTRITLRSRLAGWLLALAYVCTMPAVLPAAFATLARVEGSHRVNVQMCAGETRLVLAHDAPAGMKSHEAIHHHCLLARMITRFAEPNRGNGPDHLLKFNGGTNRLMEKRVVAPDPSHGADAVTPEIFLVLETALPRLTIAKSWRAGAPLRPPAGLFGLKSTLLLI